MNKIKLVIEMPEDVYTRTFDNGVPISLADGIVIDRAIRTGTVLPDKHGRLIDTLDQIRAELEEYITHSPYIKSFMDCCRLRDDVMRIIDRYRNEVSE